MVHNYIMYILYNDYTVSSFSFTGIQSDYLNHIRLKGAVSRQFSSRFVKTSLKLRLNDFTHTQNAPGTPRGRYQVNFCKESKP